MNSRREREEEAELLSPEAVKNFCGRSSQEEKSVEQ